MRPEVKEDVLNKLDSFNEKSSKFIDQLVSRSQEFSKLKTSVLFGIIGGASFSFLGVVMTTLGFVSSIPPSVFLLSIGIAIGVLIARGPKNLRFERHYNNRKQAQNSLIEENRLLAQEYLNRIAQLPEGTPEKVRLGLYAQYQKINEQLIDIDKRLPQSSAQDRKWLENNRSLTDDIAHTSTE